MKIQVKVNNWFYYSVGLIGVFSAVTHTIDGNGTELPMLYSSNLESMRQAIFVFNYHIVAADHLGLGIALIIMAFYRNMIIAKSAAYVVILIMLARVIVCVLTVFATLNNTGYIGTFWIPAIANTICIISLWLGTKVKSKEAI